MALAMDFLRRLFGSLARLAPIEYLARANAQSATGSLVLGHAVRKKLAVALHVSFLAAGRLECGFSGGPNGTHATHPRHRTGYRVSSTHAAKGRRAIYQSW
jgi:hypothetical protein